MEVLNECVNAGIKLPEKEGVKIDMCKAMDGLIEEGRAEGRAEGAARMSRLVSVLLSQEKYEEIRKVTSDEKVREEYYTLYHI